MATAVAWGALALATFTISLAPPIDDYWLALASAREIVSGADLARAVPLDWSPHLTGALNPQWLAQLAFGVVPLPLSLAVNAGLLSGGLLVTTARARAAAGSAGVAVAMLLVIATLSPHLIVRPQSFSIALAPAAFLLLERFANRPWMPPTFGALVAVWANLHGAFVIGQLAALAAAAASCATALRSRRAGGSLPIALATAAVALVAPLLNPAGLDLLTYAYGQGTSSLVRDLSVEWQPAWPWHPVGALFWAFAGIVLAGRVVRRGAIGLGPALILVGLGILAATGIRHVPWFVLAAAPVVAGDVDAALAARPALARAVGRVRGLMRRRPRVALVAAAALTVAISLLRPALPAGVARLEQDAPAASTSVLDSILGQDEQVRILNEQVWGGYLAWRLGDRVEIAMDGRIEIRSRSTWAAYLALMNGEGDPARQLSAEGVRWAVLRANRAGLITRLVSAGWQRVWADDREVVLRSP